MLTISSIKIQTPQSKSNINHKSISFGNSKQENYTLFDNFSFFENYNFIQEKINTNIEINKRPITRESTQKELEKTYSNYKKSLNEITKEDIEKTINEIKQTTQYSQSEILNAMQKATQFGNMNSLHIITNAMNKNNVGILMGGKNPISRYGLGLNSSLNYLIDQKRLSPLNSSEYAVFLDNNKLEQLELINQKNPEKFNEYKNLGITYFILSGFDKGINFIDRSKDLKTITLNTLEEPNIDIENIERAKKLGLHPIIIIENKQEATINNIYNQLKPNQIDKKQLEAVIDANVMYRFSNQEQQEESKKLLIKYLDKNLNIYTPESLSKTSQNMYKNILSTLHKQGKTIDDSIFLITNLKKSPALINHQFQLVNDIPRNKFITFERFEKNYDSDYKDKTIIILDDATISGISLINLSEKIRQNYPNNNIMLAPLYISETAKENINFEIEKNKRLDKEILIDTPQKNHNNIRNTNPLLKLSLGNTGFENSEYCILFPYMCPDNNSEFANNLGLLHHVNYDKNKLDEPQRFISIKNLTNDNIEIAKLTEKILGDKTK